MTVRVTFADGSAFELVPGEGGTFVVWEEGLVCYRRDNGGGSIIVGRVLADKGDDLGRATLEFVP